MVALFWSFTASCTNAESAKKGFPLIIFGAQFGSILGPTIDTYAEEIGMANLMLCACVGIFCIGVMIKIFMIFVGEQENTKSQNSRKPTNQTGMLEGLRLLVTKPYVLGIFCIATFHEIVSTIVDFQMKLTARQTHATPESFASFMGHFGQTVNIITMLMALFGTTYLMQKYGLRFCVILFPVLVGIVLTGIYLNPSINMVFMGMVAIKSLSYGLNNPSKEMMYIPTTKDVKFKAKGWIDTFGSRSSKAGGALINNSLKHSMTALLAYGTIISLGVIAVWIVVAMFVGTKYQTLTDEGKVIGEDGEESIENGVDIGRAQPA